MSAPKSRRLKDGRLPGVLRRRLLDAMVARPGRIVSPDELRPLVWPNGAPANWRLSLARIARDLGVLLPGVVQRLGSRRRLAGFQLHPAKLPKDRLVAGRQRKAYARWTANEDRCLLENVPHLPLDVLTRLVNQIGGNGRTVAAVEARIYTKGLSKVRPDTFSVGQMASILGAHPEKIVRWIESGMLRAARERSTRGATYAKHPGKWTVRLTDAEAFILAYPWEVDWLAMQQGHSLTVRTAPILRRDPYLTVAQAARRVGVSEGCLWQRYASGHIQDAVRVTPFEATGDPKRATIRIPLSALHGMPVRMAKGPRSRSEEAAS